MVAPLLGFTRCCCKRIPRESHSGVPARAISVVAGLAVDTIASITCLVIGILGLTGVLAHSPALSYSLIGVSAGTTALYLAYVVKGCCVKLQRSQYRSVPKQT